MARYITGAAQMRFALQAIMVACCLWWLVFWILQPLTKGYVFLTKFDMHIKARFAGTSGADEIGDGGYGSAWAFMVAPVLLITFLSFFAVELTRRIRPKPKENKKPRINIWTMPIFVRSPIGMLNLGECLFIFAVVFASIFYTVAGTLSYVSYLHKNPREEGDPPDYVNIISVVAVYMGIASLCPFALLWIPVSRGSPLLRVLGVPFEHAVKHHVWLGSFTVWLATGHSVGYIFYFIYVKQGFEVGTWVMRNEAYLPGVIAWVAGVFMLVTSLNFVRRRYYDFFFRLHHLYLIYTIFYAFHAVYLMYFIIVPIILFFLDRFVRFVQSRKSVDVLSAKVLPSGAMELRFAKPNHFEYNALSFMYMLLPSVSRLEWHAFSVASSPLDGTNEISIYIKPLGGFTKDLHDALISSKRSQSGHYDRPTFKCPFSFKLQVEGPYGDESSFYLKYQSLVMVAGGIGVTPFLAILRDILHRYQMAQEDLPTSIHLIFCCRRKTELHILDTIAPNTILPGYQDHLDIKIHAFCTSIKSEEDVDEADVLRDGTTLRSLEQPSCINIQDPKLAKMGASQTFRTMSPIITTGSTPWVAATVFGTLIGFFVIWGIFSVTFLHTTSHNYAYVLSYILCTFLAVVGCGGAVLLLWTYSEKKNAGKTESRVTARGQSPSPPHDEKDIEKHNSALSTDQTSIWSGDVIMGRRPNWKDTFSEMATIFGGQNVGVMVSGSHTMQQDVARECQKQSLSRSNKAVLHYHSVSFEL